MKLHKLIAWITAGRPARASQRLSYEAVFKGSANCPATAGGNFLPGLRTIENEVDTYFKDVFAGPVF